MTDPQNENPTAASTVGHLHRKLWIWGIVLAVLALPPLWFLAESTSANRTRIPPQFMELPPDWAGPPVSSTPDASPQAHTNARATATSTTSPVRTHARSDPSAEFLALLEAGVRERPEQEGARLYLSLVNRFKDGDAANALNVLNLFFGGPNGRNAKTLPSDATEWLKAHADLAEALLCLAESPDLPLHLCQPTAQTFSGRPGIALARPVCRGSVPLDHSGQR